MLYMSETSQWGEDYRRIEQAIGYLEANYARQPELKEIADSLHLSEYHFQRLFTRWAGISPKRFVQFLTKENAKELLLRSTSLLDAAFESGLSGPGRLHDLFVSTEAVTPGQYRSRGEGMTIRYGFHPTPYPTPFGEGLIGLAERGVCHLAFVMDGDREAALAAAMMSWRKAGFEADPDGTRPWVERIFLRGLPAGSEPLPLFLKGTNFQLKVWEALLRIPAGAAISYEDLARRSGAPRAPRAVGSAVARNSIAVLIPCHRVLRKVGAFGNYAYGPTRKMALLAWEQAQLEPAGPPGALEADNAG
jgi:AraC family transcriptional regulator of adaptative response/methylated-DNA-[protein]-cysteine methyltransferase